MAAPYPLAGADQTDGGARHADPTSDLDSAEVAVSELLSNLPRHAPGPAWVSLT